MKIDTVLGTESEAAAVVKISGEAVLMHAEEMRNALLAALDAAPELTVDLSGVEEADLALFQILCSLHRSSIVMGKKIVLTGLESEPLVAVAQNSGFARHTGCSNDTGNTCFWRGGDN